MASGNINKFKENKITLKPAIASSNINKIRNACVQSIYQQSRKKFKSEKSKLSVSKHENNRALKAQQNERVPLGVNIFLGQRTNIPTVHKHREEHIHTGATTACTKQLKSSVRGKKNFAASVKLHRKPFKLFPNHKIKNSLSAKLSQNSTNLQASYLNSLLRLVGGQANAPNSRNYGLKRGVYKYLVQARNQNIMARQADDVTQVKWRKSTFMPKNSAVKDDNVSPKMKKIDPLRQMDGHTTTKNTLRKKTIRQRVCPSTVGGDNIRKRAVPRPLIKSASEMLIYLGSNKSGRRTPIRRRVDKKTIDQRVCGRKGAGDEMGNASLALMKSVTNINQLGKFRQMGRTITKKGTVVRNPMCHHDCAGNRGGDEIHLRNVPLRLMKSAGGKHKFKELPQIGKHLFINDTDVAEPMHQRVCAGNGAGDEIHKENIPLPLLKSPSRILQSIDLSQTDRHNFIKAVAGKKVIPQHIYVGSRVDGETHQRKARFPLIKPDRRLRQMDRRTLPKGTIGADDKFRQENILLTPMKFATKRQQIPLLDRGNIKDTANKATLHQRVCAGNGAGDGIRQENAFLPLMKSDRKTLQFKDLTQTGRQSTIKGMVQKKAIHQRVRPGTGANGEICHRNSPFPLKKSVNKLHAFEKLNEMTEPIIFKDKDAVGKKVMRQRFCTQAGNAIRHRNEPVLPARTGAKKNHLDKLKQMGQGTAGYKAVHQVLCTRSGAGDKKIQGNSIHLPKIRQPVKIAQVAPRISFKNKVEKVPKRQRVYTVTRANNEIQQRIAPYRLMKTAKKVHHFEDLGPMGRQTMIKNTFGKNNMRQRLPAGATATGEKHQRNVLFPLRKSINKMNQFEKVSQRTGIKDSVGRKVMCQHVCGISGTGDQICQRKAKVPQIRASKKYLQPENLSQRGQWTAVKGSVGGIKKREAICVGGKINNTIRRLIARVRQIKSANKVHHFQKLRQMDRRITLMEKVGRKVMRQRVCAGTGTGDEICQPNAMIRMRSTRKMHQLGEVAQIKPVSIKRQLKILHLMDQRNTLNVTVGKKAKP